MTELLGREKERGTIDRLLAVGEGGQRGLLLEGEAGIGKTSLWRAARSAGEASGYGVLSAAPTEAESALPYSVLGDLLDGVPDEVIAYLSTPLRVALEAALFRRITPEGATDQLAVCSAFVRVLRYLAADRPLLLAVDDLQWADAPSARVLDFALRRLEREPIKLLIAVRVSAGVSGAASLLPALGNDRIERVVVGPLSQSAIDDLLLARLERPLRRPEFSQLYGVCGGNPFFALELGRFLIERPSTSMVGEPPAIPHSLADVVRERIAKLPKSTRELLVPVAALASPTEATMQQLDGEASSVLEVAIGAQVLERVDGRLRFTHPLLASAVYGIADTPTRRHWHARLAELVKDPERRAHHLALAASGPDAPVADALDAAARSANARGAPDAASRLAEQSAQLTPERFVKDIQRRRIASAEYRLRAGDGPGARAMLENLVSSLPAERRPAEALRLLGNIAFTEGNLVEAERLLTAALAQARGDEPVEAIVERDLIRVFNQRGDVEASRAHTGRLSRIADRLQDPFVSELALRIETSCERRGGRRVSDEARSLAVALAEDRLPTPVDDSPGVMHPLFDWAVILKWSDDFARARVLFRRVLSLTEGRDESVRAPVLFHLAEMECWAGDWPLAALYTEECRKATIHAGQQAYARLWLVASSLLGCYRGELAAARVDATEALEISRRVGDDPYQCRALAILGSIELASGDPIAANRYFEMLRGRLAHQEGWHAGVIRSEAEEVEALLALGRLEEAERIGARAAKLEEQLGDPWQRAVGRRCQALLAAARGELTASVTEFEATLRVHDEVIMPLERARVLLSYGAALRRSKRKRDARAALTEAQRVFAGLGAMVWLERTAEELARIPAASSDTRKLTPTESRVATLVARGRSNREVAQELFLSEKTVEANLSRVYHKLGLRSRSQLAAQMASER